MAPNSVSGESSRGGPAATTGAIHEELKVREPDTYSGERSKLKHLLLQVELYIGFNSTRFASDTEKVAWTVTLLRGPALNWVEGYLADYLSKQNNGNVTREMKPETVKIFHTFAGFRDSIMQIFGEIDEGKHAVRELQTLRQRGSAATYTAEFQRHSSKTG